MDELNERIYVYQVKELALYIKYLTLFSISFNMLKLICAYLLLQFNYAFMVDHIMHGCSDN